MCMYGIVFDCWSLKSDLKNHTRIILLLACRNDDVLPLAATFLGVSMYVGRGDPH